MIRDTFDFAMGAVVGALGDEVIWKPGRPDERKIQAVFGSGFQIVASGEVRITSRRPEVMVRQSDLPSPAVEGDQIEVRGLLLEVVTPQPDVEDVSMTLVLKKAL